MSRVVFGGLLAAALLGLFVYAVVLVLVTAFQCPSQTCSLGDGLAFLLETVGALVSAVVVSELSVTKPMEAPGTHLGNAIPGATPAQKTRLQALASVYIMVWLVCGLALVIGWVQHPTVPQLISVAKEWLGVAIAAAYAYFGISP